MATDRNFLFENDLQNLDGDAIIELFVIDLFSGVKETLTLLALGASGSTFGSLTRLLGATAGSPF